MSLVTSMTRAWLTRSLKKFNFNDNYDRRISYSELEKLGLYIHIPFCRSICDFCPYCKAVFDEQKMEEYIDSLTQEIDMVGNMHIGKKDVSSLYFGGGSPALAKGRLNEIVQKVNEHFNIKDGIGIELHPEDVNVETLRILKDAGVDKISIGIQSFSDKFGALLGRKAPDADKLKSALEQFDFKTVSMDFIFALPMQTFDDIMQDIDTAVRIGANHVAIYPFVRFSFADTSLPEMPGREKRSLLNSVTEYLYQVGYSRTSIWTFAKNSSNKYSSMTRDNFLGFGCSATTLLKDQFKVNTFDIDSYIGRIKIGELPTSLTIKFSLRQRMVYYLFWAAYGLRIDKNAFLNFFGMKLDKMYGWELKVAEWLGFLKGDNDGYQLTDKGAYYFHYYESYYTLAYIDEMWDTMRKEAFPDKIEF